MTTILSILAGISAIAGTTEAIKQSHAKARREEHRSRKCNLIINCPKSSEYSHLLHGRQVVLSGDKLYIDTGTNYDLAFGHPFAGYFHPYPDTPFSGLISTIADDPPIMNWIYVERDTHEVKFGTRPFAEHQFKGPFDCTRLERRLTFGGWEGFVAVLEEGGFWGLYFDVDHDKLKGKLAEDTPVLEVQLTRRELKNQITIKIETGEDSGIVEGGGGGNTALKDTIEVD